MTCERSAADSFIGKNIETELAHSSDPFGVGSQNASGNANRRIGGTIPQFGRDFWKVLPVFLSFCKKKGR